MQLISKYNKTITYLLCVIDLFSKYAWIVLLKDKKGVTTVNEFHSISNSSKRKLHKTSADQESELYNKSFKKWLEDNDIEMYSTYNEGKSVVSERSVRNLKNKHMKDVSKMFILMF